MTSLSTVHLLPCTQIGRVAPESQRDRQGSRGSMFALIPQTGESSGAALGVPSEALLHVVTKKVKKK